MYKQAAYEIMEKQALNTRLTHLKPLLAKIKDEGVTLVRPSLRSARKAPDVETAALHKARVISAPGYNPDITTIKEYNPLSRRVHFKRTMDNPVIMIPKTTSFKSDPLKEKIYNTALRGINKIFPLSRTVKKDPGAVLAHELGHHKDLSRRLNRSGDYFEPMFGEKTDPALFFSPSNASRRSSTLVEENLANLNSIKILKDLKMANTPQQRDSLAKVIKTNRKIYHSTDKFGQRMRKIEQKIRDIKNKF